MERGARSADLRRIERAGFSKSLQGVALVAGLAAAARGGRGKSRVAPSPAPGGRGGGGAGAPPRGRRGRPAAAGQLRFRRRVVGRLPRSFPRPAVETHRALV